MIDIIIQLGIGGALLIGGAESITKAASALAQKLRVPPLVIGLTVVSFGTSLPELTVAINAALQDQGALAVGSVVGSNIANVLLVLGVTAMVKPITIPAQTNSLNTLVMMGSSLLFMAIVFFSTHIYFWHGATMVTMLLLYLWYLARTDHKDILQEVEENGSLLARRGSIAGLVVAAGLAGLIIGADLFVEGATKAARHLGVTETIIGIVLVAIGTSLPELVISVIASLRGHGALALGNIIGSNIFNILAILGITSMVRDLPLEADLSTTHIWVFLACAILLALSFSLSGKRFGRLVGIAFFVGYVGYITTLLAV